MSDTKSKVIVALVLFCLVQTAVLVFLTDRYQLLDRARLLVENERLPIVAYDFEQNANYRAYRELFRHYPSKPGAVLVLGDSMVAIPDWESLLRVDAGVINQGIPGDSLSGVTNRLLDGLSHDPQALVLWVGTNDLLDGKTSAALSEELSEFLNRLTKYDGQLVTISVPLLGKSVVNYEDVNTEIVAYNAELANKTRRAGGIHIDLAEILGHDTCCLPSRFTYDGLHLNGLGYSEISQALQAQLSAL